MAVLPLEHVKLDSTVCAHPDVRHVEMEALTQIQVIGSHRSRPLLLCHGKSCGIQPPIVGIQEVWDAFGVREALEVYGVEQAIKLGDSRDMAILEEKLLDHERYMPHYYTPNKFVLDSEFHTQIAAMGKNQIMKWLLKRNFEHIYLRARLDNYDPQRMAIAAQEHHRLLESMKKKDILGGIEIIRNHVQKARDNVIRCLSNEAYDEAVST